MWDYYANLAERRTRSELAAGALRGQRHMHLSYRAGLLLKTAGLGRLYENRQKFGFQLRFPVRLFPYMYESLKALQTVECSTGSEVASSRALDFLHEITGTRKGERLVD
jgi:hypothetical protein